MFRKWLPSCNQSCVCSITMSLAPKTMEDPFDWHFGLCYPLCLRSFPSSNEKSWSSNGKRNIANRLSRRVSVGVGGGASHAFFILSYACIRLSTHISRFQEQNCAVPIYLRGYFYKKVSPSFFCLQSYPYSWETNDSTLFINLRGPTEINDESYHRHRDFCFALIRKVSVRFKVINWNEGTLNNWENVKNGCNLTKNDINELIIESSSVEYLATLLWWLERKTQLLKLNQISRWS